MGDIAQFEDRARLLQGLGYVAALADYRVSCRDASDVTQSLADGQDAYEWLRIRAVEFGFDPANMFLSGGSAGGHLALTSAMLARDKPAGLILFNPVVDLRITAKPDEMATAVRISPSDLSVEGMPPVLIMQGDADKTTPIGQSREFCGRMNAKGLSCELVEYAGRDHGFFSDRAIDPLIQRSPHDDTTERMLNFLANHSSSRR